MTTTTESTAVRGDVSGLKLTNLRIDTALRYAVSSGTDLRFDFYQGRFRPVTSHHSTPSTPPPAPTPVLIWVPQDGDEEFDPVRRPDVVDNRYPTPLAPWVAYGFAVVSAGYASRASRAKDLDLLIAHLREHAVDLHVDAQAIGVLTAESDGYTARIAGRDDDALRIDVSDEGDPRGLLSEEVRHRFVDWFGERIGGAYDAAWSPMEMPVPDVTWVDPCLHTSPLGRYRLYPTPRRGAGTSGSYVVSLPAAYDEDESARFPVIYFLHGGGGNQRESGNWLIEQADRLTAAGEMPPTIVVSVQALPVGWFSNGRVSAPGVLAGPVEDVIMQDLIPHVDATYRTIASREGRALEGWSAGGFGALRLAFKYPEVFGAASSLAGAVIDFDEEPNPAFIAHTFGPPEDPETRAYFDEIRPQHLAEVNAARIIELGVQVRLLVGDGDWLYEKDGQPITQRLSRRLDELGIENTYTVLTGVDHMMTRAFASGVAPYPAAFWQNAFAAVDPRR